MILVVFYSVKLYNLSNGNRKMVLTILKLSNTIFHSLQFSRHILVYERLKITEKKINEMLLHTPLVTKRLITAKIENF